MIYTVECSFSDPGQEADWNDFYSLAKLPALISVRGFHTSQRFQALSSGCTTYLALHSIDHLEVLTGEEYRHKGGGNFARWQAYITEWQRNLYAGLDRAPTLAPDDCLILSSRGPEPLLQLGLVPAALRAVALDQNPAQRWLATAPRHALPAPEALPTGVHLYAPMTAALTSALPASPEHRLPGAPCPT